MDRGESRNRFWRRALPALAAIVLLAALHLTMAARLPGQLLTAGSSNIELNPWVSQALLYYLIFGLMAMGLLAWGFRRLAPGGAEWLLAKLEQGRDRDFVLAAAICAFALGIAMHQVVLLGLPLTDDENAYRLAARILAEGRLYLPSDPDRHFFHHNLVVNDGKVYTQYFLGWPALLAPAAAVGLERLMNPLLFALTVPAVFLLLRGLAGRAWARLGSLLMLSSPMLVITAGTLLSHTSCVAALAYFFYCAWRCRQDGAGWRWHAALATMFSIAFFIRPLTALGLGLPCLATWLWDRRSSPGRRRELAAFALPAAFFAFLFFGANRVLTGDALVTPYAAYLRYLGQTSPEPELAFRSAGYSLSIGFGAFLRLSFAAFAWPLSWLFVFLAGRGPFRGVLLASLASLFAANLTTTAVGIDLYAPMHFIEAGLPMVLLTALGIEWSFRRGTEIDAAVVAAGGRAVFGETPLLLAAASAVVAGLFLVPYQLATIHRAARLEATARAGLDEISRPALVFVKQPYARPDCFGGQPRHWVRQSPIELPAFDPPVIWASHIDLRLDREFAARRFPGRAAYLLGWRPGTCERLWVPLAEARVEDFPPDEVRIYF